MIIRYQNHSEKVYFYLANIDKSDVIIGHNWLRRHNLEINWETGEVSLNRCPSSCGRGRIKRLKKEAKEQKHRKAQKYQKPEEVVGEKEITKVKDKKFRWVKENHQYVQFFHPEVGIFDNLWFERSQMPAMAALHINTASNISQHIA